MAPQKPGHPFWTGGAAASLAAWCTHPLDVMRVRMQTAAQKTTFVRAIRDVLQTAGLRGLYTGLTASIFRQMTYSIVRSGAYDKLKTGMAKGGKKLSTFQMVLCASGAGALGGLAGNPADIILVRMVADPNKAPEQRVNYRNALQRVYRMVRGEGVSSLIRGLAPNAVRVILMNLSQLVSYDCFKDALLANNVLVDGMPLHFLSSAAAGTVATTICAPADVLKGRLMNIKGKEQSVIGVLTDSLWAGGLRFLFRGWLPAWIRLTPDTICMFMFLEQMRKGIDYIRDDRTIREVKADMRISRISVGSISMSSWPPGLLMPHCR